MSFRRKKKLVVYGETDIYIPCESYLSMRNITTCFHYFVLDRKLLSQGANPTTLLLPLEGFYDSLCYLSNIPLQQLHGDTQTNNQSLVKNTNGVLLCHLSDAVKRKKNNIL